MEKIPEAVIRRLPKYHRYLSELLGKVNKISSETMSRDLSINASQIRRDLNYFGGFGQQGYGYSVDKLLSELNKILGKDIVTRAVIVGAGNIGLALKNYAGFLQEGISIEAMFDPAQNIGGVRPMDELVDYVKENNIEIGIIAAPKSCAQSIADMLTRAGVKGIWNFAPTEISTTACVENVHLSDSLNYLKFAMFNETEVKES